MRTLTLFATALALVTASAQDGNRAAPESTDPLYHVEVILFEWVQGNRTEEDFFHGNENPRHEPAPTLLQLPRLELESLYDFDPRRGLDEGDLPTDTATPPELPADTTTTLEVPAVDEAPQDRLELIEPWREQGRDPAFLAFEDEAALPDGFRLLGAHELELVNASTRLDRSPYRLLGHAGWVQTGVDADRAVALDLRRLGIVNPKGTIKVYLGRYLHAAVDLEFLDGRGTFWSAPGGFGPTPLEYARRYRLESEHNAFRTGDLVAIDHPLFGVLVRVTEAPEPEDEAGAESAGRPAG